MTLPTHTHVMSSPEQATIRSSPQTTRRFLSYIPRLDLLAGTLTGWAIDSRNTNLYQLYVVDVTEDEADAVQVGNAIWIGSAPGKYDRSVMRVRAPVFWVGDTLIIPVNESAQGLVRMHNGDAITVVDQHSPKSKIPRLLPVNDSSGMPVDFTEFHDYDITYTDQNVHQLPVANVTSGFNYDPIIFAGFVNDSGYRDVSLDTRTSQSLTDPITGYAWTSPGSSFLLGSSSTSTCTLRFETQGFFWVKLVLSTAYHSVTRWIPIWVHGPDYMPVTQFQVKRDERSEWREIDLSLFSKATDIADLVPGATLNVWELPSYAGDPAPGERPTQMIGWSARGLVGVKGRDDTWDLTVVGIGGWVNVLQGFGQLIIKHNDGVGQAAAWNEMTLGQAYVDRVLLYVAREYSNILDLANLYLLSGNTHRIEEEEVKTGTQWEQMKYLISGYLGKIASDSGGAIWATLQPWYGTQDDLDAWPTVISLDQRDWIYDPGLTLTIDVDYGVTQLSMSGSMFDGNKSHELASVGPGDAPVGIGDTAEGPYQRLTHDGYDLAQAQLNSRSGAEWNRQASKTQSFQLELLGDLDVYEPAWGEIVRLSLTQPNNAGLTLTDVPVTVTNVSVAHAYDKGSPKRVVTWTCEIVSVGLPGTTVVLPESPTPGFVTAPAQPPMLPVAIPPIDGLYPNVQTAIAFPRGGTTIYRTGPEFNGSGLDVVSPVWDPTDLTDDSSIDGEIEDFASDPASPHYLNTGSTIDGWLLTTTYVYRMTDVGGSVLASLGHALPNGGDNTSMRRSIVNNRGIAGNCVVIGIDLDDAAHLYCSKTDNSGASWTDHTINTLPAVGELCIYPISLFRFIEETDTAPRHAAAVGTFSLGFTDSGGSTFDADLPGYTGVRDVLGFQTIVAWEVTPPTGELWTTVTSSNVKFRYHLRPGYTNGECYNWYFAYRIVDDTDTPGSWHEQTELGGYPYAPDTIYTHTFPVSEVSKVKKLQFQIAVEATCHDFAMNYALDSVEAMGSQHVYGTWAPVDGGADRFGPHALNFHPGAWVSPRNSDRIYTTWPRSDGGFLAMALAKSLNAGASFSDADTAEWVFMMGTDVEVPLGDDTETVVYHGMSICGDNPQTTFGLEAAIVGGVGVDVTPGDALPYGIVTDHCHPISISPDDQNTVLVTLARRDEDGTPDDYGVFLTRDGGSTWLTLIPSSVDLKVRSVAITLDGAHWFAWGIQGFVGVSTDDGTALLDRTGNMPDDILIAKIVGG